MIKRSKLTLATLALLLSAFAVHAQPAPDYARPRTAPSPKVVFIGDWVTYSWTDAFAANANWVNQGTPWTGVYGQSGDSESTAARFQADVVTSTARRSDTAAQGIAVVDDRDIVACAVTCNQGI
jgi:hypothetical protein